MNTQTFDRISDLIRGSKQIVVVLGGEPNVDTTAAALSLYLSLTNMGKNVNVLSPQPPTVALGNLVGVDKINQYNGGGSAGLIISLPYQQGAIEKISYDIVGDRINLTVVPGTQGITFTTDDITYQTPTQKADLIISVGVPQEAQVSTIANDTQSPLINIDSSSENAGFGTVAFLDTAASSRSELVAKLLFSMDMPIDRDIAQNLLSGIIDATGNFQREDTSVGAFEAAALLIAKGARREPSVPRVRDSFIASEEAKIGGDGISPRFPAWQQPATGSKPRNLAPKVSQMAQQVTNTKSDKSSTAPKDWFEPKIYSGSKTPIS